MQPIKIAGNTHALGKRIGHGGEGDVFLVEGLPDRAVKIYKENLLKSREPKVRAMVQRGLAASTELVAFPADIITDLNNGFRGFAMRLVSGYWPIHELYGPKSRRNRFPKVDYRHIVRAAQNVARAVARVHQTGCVIGDFNHSGVLVSSQATVALIDADSFQFTLNGKSYPCVVGVPDFTAPELQGKNLNAVVRTKAQDHFGLAVAIFQLLAMSRHPYAGRFAGGDLSMSEAIAQNRFAYSTLRRGDTRTAPPPGSIALKDLSAAVAQAFEAAFGMDPAARPDAPTWVSLLQNLEAGLSHCTKNARHYYPSAAGECVWCRLARETGVDMFPETLGADIPIAPGGPFDIEQIWAQIRAAVLPQPAAIIPTWRGSLGSGSPAVAEANRAVMGRRAIGLLALIAAAAGFVYASPLAIVWLGLGGFGLFRLFGSSVETDQFRRAYAQADQRARDLEIAFLQRIGLTELYGVRDDLEGWITQYRQLDADLNRELANLRSTREARQRDAFLDRYLIRRAKISGIGPAKSATLASFGIETAADLNERAVLAVPGFGEMMTAKLMKWRRFHEARFHYNPAPDASDIQAEKAVRSALAAKRGDLQLKIRSGLTALQTGPQQVTARAKAVDQALVNALGERAKAAHDLQLLGLPVPVATPITISPRPSASAPPQAPPAGWSATPQGVPKCPRCGSFMVRRTARHGFRAGSQFWGCSRYPTCTGTRN